MSERAIGYTRFPHDPDDQESLLRPATWAWTVLRQPVTPGDAALPVESTAGFAPSGLLQVRSGEQAEWVSYTGTTPDSFTGCERGAFLEDGGILAMAHPPGAEISQLPGPTHHRVLVDALVAVEETLLAGAFGGEGATGPTGPVGPEGIDAFGPEGPTGPTGPANGIVGPQGAPGPPGDPGPQGAEGPEGAPSTVTGPAGPPGLDGANGPQGGAGPTGPGGLGAVEYAAEGTLAGSGGRLDVRGGNGVLVRPYPDRIEVRIPSTPGPTGPQGTAGATGPGGLDGVDGSPGDAGPQGATGAQGSAGAAGPAGPAGPGSTGAAGVLQTGDGAGGFLGNALATLTNGTAFETLSLMVSAAAGARSRLALWARNAGNTASYSGVLIPAVLAANRTWTLPDRTGTLMVGPTVTVRSQAIVVTPNDANQAFTISCIAGEVATGGGIWTGFAGGGATLNQSSPSTANGTTPGGWAVNIRNNTANTGQGTIYVICLAI